MHLIFLFVLLNSNPSKAQVTCISSGNFTNPAIWSPAPPVAGQFITVNSGLTLTVDSITPNIGDLIINGTVIVSSTSSSILVSGGNITVNSGSLLENDGRIDFNTNGKNFFLNGTASYIHNPLLSDSVDESIFYNSIETFSITSNLSILKWKDGSIPLGDPSRIATSFFGNLTLNASVPGGIWQQDGYFAVPAFNRIRGLFTVSTGTVVMDNGYGNTSQIYLGDVLVNGNGNIVFQRGFDRNLAIYANNFTVNSTSAQPTILMDSSMGQLTLTLTGSLNLHSSFKGITGSLNQLGSDARFIIDGNLNITGGTCNFVTKVDAPLRINVTGTTTLADTSSGGSVSFLDGGNFNLIFTSNDLNISACQNNYLFGQPGAVYNPKGTGTYTIANDLNITGNSTTYFAWSDSSIGKVRVSTGRDANLNAAGSTCVIGYTNGPVTFKTGRNFSQTNGTFTGQAFTLNEDLDSLITSGNFLFNSATSTDFLKCNRGIGPTTITTGGNFTVQNSGTGNGQGVIGIDSTSANLTFSVSGSFVQNGGQFAGIQNGSGNITFTVSGILDINGGNFFCITNRISPISNLITFLVNSIDYDGGYFSAYDACNTTTTSGSFTITSACKVNFTSTGDYFSFIGLPKTAFDLNNMPLSLSIGGTLTLSGVNGTFVSSQSLGQETVTMTGLSISGGINSFNALPGSTFGNGHFVLMTINGNVQVSGGTSYFSASTQAVTINLNGNLSLSNGSIAMKGGDNTGTAVLNITGGYSQSGGSFYLHNAPTDDLNTAAVITLNVNSDGDNSGDFTHTGGTLNYDNATNTPASLNLSLIIKSPNYTLGGSGLITMTKAGTGTIYGIMSFARAGTISCTRTGTHTIQQVIQTIQSGCTLDMVSGDLLLASHNTKRPTPDWLTVIGTLNMRTNRIFSNVLNPYSGVTVFGTLKTMNANGLYNGTTSASFATTLTDSLDYFLGAGSTVEYNGANNQIITGIGVGKALLAQHKYFALVINFSGTPDVEFVYPTNSPTDSSVLVRGSINLLAGELNLDNDHNPSNGGGRWITLEAAAGTSLSRTAGYIRSEVENGNGLFKWVIGTNATTHIIPFGYNSSTYIPLTAAITSGNAGSFYAGTYRTSTANLPLPPTVSNLTYGSGNNLSPIMIDRFWYVNTAGATPTMNLNFSFSAAEAGSITDFRAIRWNTSTSAWTNPPPGTQTPQTFAVQANGLSTLKNWWTVNGTLYLNITSSAGANGTISPVGITPVLFGTNQSYTITPSACYNIADVIVDGVSQGAISTYTFTNVITSHSISASFVRQVYTISASAGANGSISPSGSTSVNCGDNQTFNFIPDACYAVQNVIVDGVSQGAISSYTFTNVTVSHSISVTFIQQTYSVTATAGANGNISPSGVSVVSCSSNQTYTITPDACYAIQDVVVDGVSQGALASYTFTNITANHTISATFVQLAYSISASSGANGNISPSGSTSVLCGNSQSYTISPSSCYQIADVTVDGVSQGPIASYTFSNVNANHSIAASFTQIVYTISASAGSNGSISPSGNSNVFCGDTLTYSITADPCYDIADVLVDGVSQGPVSSYTFSGVFSNHTIVASFSLQTYTLTLSSGPNGSISPSGTITVNCGSSQTVLISPASCYQIQDVLVDGISQGPVSSYTFSGITANHTLSASFVLLNYTISASAGLHGSITPSGNSLVNCGDSITFSIVADDCYAIEDVLIDGVSVGALSQYTFSNVTASHTISATFNILQYSISASAGLNGSISPSGTTVKNCGDSLSIIISPDPCFHIQDVLVDGISQGSVSSYTFTDIRANHSISASFERNQYILSASAGANGNISPAGTLTVPCDTSLTYSITPDPCYAILDVVVDGISHGAIPSYTFSNVNSDHSIVASFVLLTYSVTASAGPNGTITLSGINTVNCGDSISFSITPDTCYQILDVVVDGISQGALSTFTFASVQTSHTIQATFSKISYTISVSAGSGGSISPSGSVSVFCGDDQSFIIQPDTCFVIGDVLIDGISQGPISSWTFTSVTGNHTISATFNLINYTLHSSSGLHGSITPDGDVIRGCGSDQHYSFAPDSCYEISDVIVDGVSQGVQADWTFNSIGSNHSISVSYALRSYTINASGGLHGSISPAGNSIVNCGDSLTITFVADTCYQINSVIVDGINIGFLSSYTFSSVGADHTISVDFVPITYTVFASVGSNGSITPPGLTTANCGDTIHYSISANTCYAIADVVVDGLSVGAVSSYAFTGSSGSHTIHATFYLLTYNFTVSSGPFGSIDPGVNETVDCGTNKTYTFVPQSCYQVSDVVIDGNSVGPVSTYSFNPVTANHSISATFSLITYTITATAGLHGSISPNGTSVINCGDSLAYTIVPDSGFLVLDVVVDGTSQGDLSSYVFNNIQSNHTIQVSFIPNCFPPVLTCIADVNVWNTPGNCDEAVNYGMPLVSGTSPVLTYEFSGATFGSGNGNGSGELFNPGQTQVKLTATNGCGSDTCSFFVNLTDTLKPIISCPTTVTLIAEAGLCSSSASIGTASASDNCPGVVLSFSPAGPYAVGTTLVTWTALDVHGNSASCIQTVVVTDEQNPEIVCPSDLFSNSVNPALGSPLVSDNCGISSTTNDAPLVFPYGFTTVTWTVNDVNGNSAICTQVVEVQPAFDTLNVRLFIQGYYNPGSVMNSALYNSGVGMDPTEIDTVHVCLIDPNTLVQVECYDGILKDDGSLSCAFTHSPGGNSYYIQIRHRNTLETWSANPVPMTYVSSYDFSISDTSAYGGNMVQVEPGVWAVWSGDCADISATPDVQDGFIDSGDFSAIENDTQNFSFGYITTDLTGDAITESTDYSVVENNSQLFLISSHP